MKTKLELNVYIIDRGDEVFIPNFMFPKNPPSQRLSKTNAYATMHVKKQSNVVQRESCNDTTGYVYGGMNSHKSLPFLNYKNIH